jgi:hypothetical protein
MTLQKRIWLTLGLLHIALVAVGAFQLSLKDGLLQNLNVIYGRISGSTSGYAFFAPGVDSELRAKFLVHNSEGNQIAEVPLEQGKNREADLRVGNIIGWFWREGMETKQQRSMTASWAGKIFARYPEAANVVVALEKYHLPSMAEFKSGQRPHWVKYYTAKYVRKEN